MAHAVLPKEAWLLERKIQAEWPISGVPQCVHADNGSDFKGEALRRGCEDYGIRIDFRPPGRAHFGGHIERLIGTLMQRVHTLPGTTYSNPLERGDYRSEKAVPHLEGTRVLVDAGDLRALPRCHPPDAGYVTAGGLGEGGRTRDSAVAAPRSTAVLHWIPARRRSHTATHWSAAREHPLLVRLPACDCALQGHRQRAL